MTRHTGGHDKTLLVKPGSMFKLLSLIPMKRVILIRESSSDALHVLATERAYPVLPFLLDELGPEHVRAFRVLNGVGLELQDAWRA